jgi:hypothetical protein
MRFHHHLGNEEIVKSDSTSFLLSRKAGGYISLGMPNRTRYQGLCHLLPYGDTWELVKSIESISIDDSAEEIVLLADTVERVYKTALERFTVLEGAVSYDVTHYKGIVRLALDMRFIHDFETNNRNYTVQEVPGGQVVTYTCPRYSFSLAILGARGSIKPQWREVNYDYDASRSSPSKYWVYDCLEFSCDHSLHLRFGVGWTVAAAISQAGLTNPQQHILTHPDNDAALQAAIADLDGLLTTLPHLDLGILAGYPWFYQVYTRDEAISVGALIRTGHVEQAKKILLRELQHLLPDGRISNRFPYSEVASADGVGWAFLRLHELYKRDQLSHDEQVYVRTLLEKSLIGLQQHHTQEVLITNGWKETWMDTTGGYEDGRQGCRIEIQALTLNMYQFMAELCDKLKDGDAQYYQRKEELLRSAVAEKFFDANTGILADGIADHIDRTIRPNIFIAYYAYSELLSKQQWRQAFTNALRKLWLPWGGLASIDKEHLLFTPHYTGENDKSYHRGDSWYFLNNIAAIGLFETGFVHEAEKIYQASRTQLLTNGIPSHAAETSSANALEGVGCYSQAWSAATFVELHLLRASLHHRQSSS